MPQTAQPQNFVPSKAKVSALSPPPSLSDNPNGEGDQLDSSYLINSVLGTLAPAKPMGHNTSSVAKALRVVLESTQDGTLTEDEADAVIAQIAGNFVGNQFDQVLERVAGIGGNNGFVATYQESSYD